MAAERGRALDLAALPLRERKRVMTRQAILDAAERGFEHVTVAQIADAASVSVKTLFVYFRSKRSPARARAAGWRGPSTRRTGVISAAARAVATSSAAAIQKACWTARSAAACPPCWAPAK